MKKRKLANFYKLDYIMMKKIKCITWMNYAMVNFIFDGTMCYIMSQ